MTSRLSRAVRALGIVVYASIALVGQTAPVASHSLAGLEFPVVMRQKVAAGKTPIGTVVQAKLAIATLVNGVVLPQDAILTGEVIESVAKSGTDPSRLAIRMDSAQWKNGSSPLKVYLTAWYYPLETSAIRDSQNDPPDVRGSISIGGTHPDVNSSTPRFPGNDRDTAAPSAPRASISKHRVLMKNVESTRTEKDQAVVLTSQHFNIKLDKSTTYVFAAGDLAAGPG